MGPLFDNSLLMINYLTYYIILYEYTLTIFLSIVKRYKIIVFIFVKFYNAYEMLNCKLILINASFMFKKQNFSI